MDRKRILVASHERSGTHFLINSLAENFGYDPVQIDIDQSHGFFGSNPEVLEKLVAGYLRMDTSRILKAHHSWPALNYYLRGILGEFHVFYIIRDGRDVMTSFWHYLNSLVPGWGPQCDSVGEFMKSTPCGGILQYQHNRSPTMLQRWIDHAESWEQATGNVSFLSYEELHSDFDATVIRISGLLEQKPAQIRRPGMDSPSSLPWRGVIGNWRNYFTDADLEYFMSQGAGRRIYTFAQGVE